MFCLLPLPAARTANDYRNSHHRSARHSCISGAAFGESDRQSQLVTTGQSSDDYSFHSYRALSVPLSTIQEEELSLTVHPLKTGGPFPYCSSWPTWELLDFQPKSPKHNQTYGLEQFRGRVTLVALLATWCPYCQRQIEKMEQLRKELSTNKFEVNFAVVNIQSGKDSQDEFISRCSFPLFQRVIKNQVNKKKGKICLYN